MAATLFNYVFLIAFGLSAAVQYNDPDALAWIAIYIGAAGMCIARLRQRLPRWLPLLLLAVCVTWVSTLLPDMMGKVSWQDIFASISMQSLAVEEAREIGGLTLIIIWASVVALQGDPGPR